MNDAVSLQSPVSSLPTSVIVDILVSPHLPLTFVRTLAACLQYHGQKATIPNLIGVARIKPRTLEYQLMALRSLGIITAAQGKHCIGPILVHPPAQWAIVANAYLRDKTGADLPSPVSGLRSPVSGLPPATLDPQPLAAARQASTLDSATDLINAALPAFLREPVKPALATRDYAAELKILDSHPALRGRIKICWLSYLERKYSAKLAAAQTSLIALCDSFVHEFLGKSTGVGVRRLADPKTDWENTLHTHIVRVADPQEFKAKLAIRVARQTQQGKAPQQKFKFLSQRRAAPTKPRSTQTPDSELSALDTNRQLRSGTNSLADAALASPVLGKILKTKPGNLTA